MDRKQETSDAAPLAALLCAVPRCAVATVRIKLSCSARAEICTLKCCCDVSWSDRWEDGHRVRQLRLH